MKREPYKRMEKVPSVMASFAERVWGIARLTLSARRKVHRAIVLSTPVYGIEAWTLHSAEVVLSKPRQTDDHQLYDARMTRRTGSTKQKPIGHSKLPTARNAWATCRMTCWMRTTNKTLRDIFERSSMSENSPRNFPEPLR